MIRCDVRQAVHQPFKEINTYGRDRSGRVLYKFNSLGFRGEEPDPSAKLRIALFGCSYAFGTGLRFEDTFAYRFKELLAAAEGWSPTDINLMSFAVGGSSNDFAVRSILGQVDRSIDLVIWNLTHASRCEYVVDGEARTINVGGIDLDKIEKADPKALAYFDFYNEEVGFLNTVKNLLLAQYFLESIGVRYIFQNGFFNFIKAQRDAYFAPFLDLLKPDFVVDNPFLRRQVDLAADAAHPGPITNTAMAINLLESYGRFLCAKESGKGVKETWKGIKELKQRRVEWSYAQAGVLYHQGERSKAIKLVRATMDRDRDHQAFGANLLRLFLKRLKPASRKNMPLYYDCIGT